MKFQPKMKNVPEIKMDSKMLLDVRDRPKFKSWIILALQHVIAMFGATVLTPILINNGVGHNVIGTDVALFSSGVGTLIYIAVTGARVPIYLGSSFAYIGAVISLFPAYGTATFFGFLGVGVVYALVSLLIYLFGTGWLKKILPPIVVGPMIMVIGLGLAGAAIGQIGITDIHTIDWWSLSITIVTIVSAMLISLLFRGRLKLIPILGALIVGFAFAMLVSTWHKGAVNYDSVDWKATSSYIGVPDFTHTMLTGQDEPKANWSFMPFFIMMPIAFATIAEHIGDHTVLGKITGRDYINGKPGVHRTILGDGLATAFAGVIGAPANTSYGENTTTVGLSRAGSVWITGLAAVFAIIMSFIQLVPSILSLIPGSVIGGVSIILFGFIASNGFKVLIDEKIDMGNMRNVFIISIMLIIGLGGAVLGGVIDNTEIKFTGTSLAMLFGITANLLLPHDRGIDESKMPKAKK